MKNIELGKSVTMSNQQLSNIIGRINALTPKNSGLDNLHVNLYVMILERIGDEIKEAINFQLYLIKNREDFDRKLPEE